MTDPAFRQLWQLARAQQATPAPAIGEIDPDAITVLDGPAPRRRPDAPSIGNVDPGALAVADPFARSRQGMRDLLASNEASRRGYNSYYGDDDVKNHPARPDKSVSQMTLGEIYAYQDRLHRAYGSTPVGRYQFTKDTLKDMQNRLGVSDDAVFDQAMQDRLADTLLVEEGFEKYANGKMSAAQFHDNIAGRWNSVEFRDTGKPYSKRKSPSVEHPPKTTRVQVLGAISEIDRDREEYRSQE